MMQQEFEALYGSEVSQEDYNNIIEPMYMATSLDKAAFVAALDKKRFALKSKDQIIKEIKQLSQKLEASCTHYYDGESEERLRNLVDELDERFSHVSTRFCGYRIEYDQKQSCYYPKYLVESYPSRWLYIGLQKGMKDRWR